MDTFVTYKISSKEKTITLLDVSQTKSLIETEKDQAYDFIRKGDITIKIDQSILDKPIDTKDLVSFTYMPDLFSLPLPETFLLEVPTHILQLDDLSIIWCKSNVETETEGKVEVAVSEGDKWEGQIIVNYNS